MAEMGRRYQGRTEGMFSTTAQDAFRAGGLYDP